MKFFLFAFLAFVSQVSSQVSNIVAISSADKQAILQVINDMRKSLNSGTYPSQPKVRFSSLPSIVWSQAYENISQIYASSCPMEYAYSMPGQTFFFDWTSSAQHVAALETSVDQLNLVSIVKEWLSQSESYDFQNNLCSQGKLCDNYIGLAYAKATSIGCSIADCSMNVAGVYPFVFNCILDQTVGDKYRPYDAEPTI